MGKTKKSQPFPKHLQDNPFVTNSQRCIDISLASAQKVVAFLLDRAGKKEMLVHFIGKKRIASLHATFFNDPSPTDCITFPFEEKDFLGEIFVCPQVAAESLKHFGGTLSNEITLYVVHGFLHLLGFDDQNPSDEKQMRLEEKKWMAALAQNKLEISSNIHFLSSERGISPLLQQSSRKKPQIRLLTSVVGSFP